MMDREGANPMWLQANVGNAHHGRCDGCANLCLTVVVPLLALLHHVTHDKYVFDVAQ